MIEQHLQILLITYNRVKFLEKTIRSFLNGPFGNCSIKILDNASTDETAQICEEFTKQFSNVTCFRHRVNTGLGGNYVRCYEFFEKDYVWIVGDDDDWNFTAAPAVISAIESNMADVIVTGGPGVEERYWGKTAGLRDLTDEGFQAFHTLGFLSAKIFSRKIIPANAVFLSHRSIYFGYLENHIIAEWIRNNVRTAFVWQPMVLRNHETIFSSLLSWFYAWVGGAESIDDPQLKNAAHIDPFRSDANFCQSLTLAIGHAVMKRQKKVAQIAIMILCMIRPALAGRFLLYLPLNFVRLAVRHFPERASRKQSRQSKDEMRI